MGRFYKGEQVYIKHAITLQEMRSNNDTNYYLNTNDVFTCVHSSQPEYLEWLEVFCNKRNIHFDLPMEAVTRILKNKEG